VRVWKDGRVVGSLLVGEDCESWVGIGRRLGLLLL
jgi:hypothetical protein